MLPCYHPLKAWKTGRIRPDTGKPIYEITSFQQEFPSFWKGGFSVPDFVEIPCGQCIGCRIEYSRQWANRCLLEMMYHRSAYFVTLTYDDDHVPRGYYPSPGTGEALPSLSLSKRDCQLFFKRLRKAVSPVLIRFFGCGEYGPSTFRPHYHFIIFGLELDDLEPHNVVGYSKSRKQVFRSKLVERAWSFPPRDDRGESYPGAEPSLAGIVTIQDVSWATCAYTARYVTKKLTGPYGQFYTDFNIIPPFSLMSRRPGIGRQYYDDHVDTDLYEFEFINVSTEQGGKKFRPPKYYHKLFDVDYPEKSAELKETRRLMAEASKNLKLQKTDLDYMEYLAVEEHNFNERIKSLKRDVI